MAKKKRDTKPKPAPKPINLAAFIASTPDKTRNWEEQFVISGTNTQGNSARRQVTVVPAITQQAAEVLHSKKFPFRSEVEIYRWCIHRGLSQLLEMESEVYSIMHLIEQANVLTRRQLYELDYSDFFIDLAKTVRGLKMEDADDEIKKLCLELQNLIAKMVPGYWRDRYVKKFETDYLRYLETNTTTGEVIWPETFGHRSINKEKQRSKKNKSSDLNT